MKEEENLQSEGSPWKSKNYQERSLRIDLCSREHRIHIRRPSSVVAPGIMDIYPSKSTNKMMVTMISNYLLSP